MPATINRKQMEDGKIKLRLAEIMKEKGITAKRLSRLTGISGTTILNAKNGHNELSARNRVIVAEALGVQVEDLYIDRNNSGGNDSDDVASEIRVPRGAVGSIAKDFGVTEKTVYNALRSVNDSPMTKKIRKYAMEHFECTTSREDTSRKTVYVAYLEKKYVKKLVAVCTSRDNIGNMLRDNIGYLELRKYNLTIEEVELNTYIEDK